jgi:mono/diheme cytochrome c family protein
LILVFFPAAQAVNYHKRRGTPFKIFMRKRETPAMTQFQKRPQMVLVLLGVITIALVASFGPVGADKTVHAQKTSPCVANPAWFTSPSPPDGNNFPQGTALTNCDFHQWAEQMFLWLTLPSNPKDPRSPRNFEVMAYPDDLFTKSGTGPTMGYPGRGLNIRQPVKLLARTEKSNENLDPDAVFQSGPGRKILVDQKGQFVYYSSYLDKDFWNFIVKQQLYKLANLQNVPSTTDFPINTLELKASWRIAALLDKNGKPTQTFIADAAKRFYTTTAKISPVRLQDGKLIEDKVPSHQMLATVALVGLHVVGIVKGHPEFIWATFEHLDNAPDYSATPAGATNPQTNGPWSFYKSGTAAAFCNQFDSANPLLPVSVLRVTPWGGGSEPNQQNQTNIQSLNASVQQALRKIRPVWANYELAGATWTGGTIPLNNGAPANLQRGSIALANTSMETFQQNATCFACHNSGRHAVAVGDSAQIIGGKILNLSHFVVNYQASQQAKARP